MKAMEAELRSSLTAGAMGFTTSRSTSHETPDRRPVASRVAPWEEVRRLVGVMGEMNAGIFEIAGESVDRELGHPGLKDYQRRLRELAVETGRPITFGLFSRKDAPDIWRTYAALLDQTAAEGGRMFAQVHSRWLSAILSFKTQLPFDRLPVWKDLRALPVEAMIALALEKDLDLFFLQPIANENQEHALELIKHPRTVVTFSDSGAHVSQLMDASLQSHLLSHWVRAK